MLRSAQLFLIYNLFDEYDNSDYIWNNLQISQNFKKIQFQLQDSINIYSTLDS